jgi:hypothetical protein
MNILSNTVIENSTIITSTITNITTNDNDNIN